MALQKFKNGDNVFIGDDSNGRVYRVWGDNYVSLTKLRFPSCTKFMPYADVLDVTDLDIENVRKFEDNPNYVSLEQFGEG